MTATTEGNDGNKENQEISVYERPSLLGDDLDSDGLYILVDTLNFGTTLTHLFDSSVTSVSVFPDESSLHTFMDGNETHLPLMNIKPTNTNFIPNSAPKIQPEMVRGYDIAATSDNGAEVLYNSIGIDKFVIVASSTNASAVIKEAYATERDIYIVCAAAPLEKRYEDWFIAKYIEYGIRAKNNVQKRRKFKRKQKIEYFKFKYFIKIRLIRNKLLSSQYTDSELEYVRQINKSRSVPARVEDNVFMDLAKQ